MKRASKAQVLKALLSHPQIIAAKPSVNWFFCQYLRKFNVLDVDGMLILHSHLPPINSKAYSRFINEHLLTNSIGPSHAQIAVTNACPQNCDYCYNKNRSGRVMTMETIKRTIRELKELGVFWFGITGGEPLLNKHLVEIVEEIGDGCAVKLFTTGCRLTAQLAADLKKAGVFSVSVSLDHWDESVHDRARRYEGAYRAALEAIDILRALGGIHVGVSAVLSREMRTRESIERFLEFLESLDVHEAWLSESKPSLEELWKEEHVVTEDERRLLIDLQDGYNKKGKMTVNYLGHFEDAQHFGCSAGHKMVYVDPFGGVSPCVFIPQSFGNVNMKSVKEIYASMKQRFPTEEKCFINRNYPILRKYYQGHTPLTEDETRRMMDEVRFGPLPRFFHLQYR